MAAALAALAGHQSRQVRQQTAQQLPQLVQTMPPSLAAATLIASAHPSLSLSVCMPVFTSALHALRALSWLLPALMATVPSLSFIPAFMID